MSVRRLIAGLEQRYKYRPLPKKIKPSIYTQYIRNLNGFPVDSGEYKRKALIDGVDVGEYERVVIGDYGAYVEFKPDALKLPLVIPYNQRWRWDIEYVKSHNLSLKYLWYVHGNIKVYYQLNTVKYADYLPNRFYISVLDFDTEENMAGPTKAQNGVALRVKYNWWSLFDHLLGSYVKGKDGLYYLNGGMGHIMGWSGRGNTGKSLAIDQCNTTIALRYNAEWFSKYDTEISAEVSRTEVSFRSAYRENHWTLPEDYDYEDNPLAPQYLASGQYNFTAADALPGEKWWSDYIRDEVEPRFKDFGKKVNVRETPFPDPIRGTNVFVNNPWLYGLDSLTEWHTHDIEKKRDKVDVGEGGQNAIAAQDPKQKSDMMDRWPVAFARGGMYLNFVAQLTDDLKLDANPMQKGDPNKKLEHMKGGIKFSKVPGRAMTFLTNSLLVALQSEELVDKNSYDPRTQTMQSKYPKGDKLRTSATDLRLVKFTQFRAKSGPTGAKLPMIFSQEEGFLIGLSEFHYLHEILQDDWGVTTNGNGSLFEIDLYPGKKYARTTIREAIEEDVKLKRALEISAAIAYLRNNKLGLDKAFREITATQLRDKIIARGYDWDEILENTVEYWTFKDQQKDPNWKGCLTAMTLLDMAVYGNCKPTFLKTRPGTEKKAA